MRIPETGFLRLRQIIGSPGKPDATPPVPASPGLIPVKKSTWWAGVRDGRYPPAIKLSPGVTVWRVEDILALIERAAADASDRRSDA